MENCIKTGASVYLPDYGMIAPADIFRVGDKMVVRFPSPIDVCGTFVTNEFAIPAEATHKLQLNRHENYWNKHLALAVVDKDDLLDMRP